MSTKPSAGKQRSDRTADEVAIPDPAERAASYEHARDELAQVVTQLETGGLGLEESLTLWERGEQLARQCGDFLDGARERVDAALDRAEDSTDTASPDDDPDAG